MNIAVVGTGYVGLVSGTCFAETGNQVICVDINEEKVKQLRNGVLPIYEPQLDQFFERNTKAGRLSFTTDLAEAVKASDIIFLALPTPSDEDGSADLKYVLGVAEDLSKLIDHFTVVVDKSTVPVGTAEKVTQKLLDGGLSQDLFEVVSNPEFLREGVAVEDFMKPDRVVIGAETQRAQDMMRRLYQPFVRQGNPIIFMDVRSAEMTKYAANSYLAARISFMNEIANLCEVAGADVDKVRLGMGSDSRIGKRFLFPGVGYGGSCFPKDVKALVHTADQHDYEFNILKSVVSVNAKQRIRFANRILDYYNGDVAGKTFAVWGLAFKPDTDDIREAPAIDIIDMLVERGAKVTAFDPEAMANVKALKGDSISFADSMYNALEGADALVIVTEWRAFRTPNFNTIKEKLSEPIIFDGRNVYTLDQAEQNEIKYFSIGRKSILN